MNRLTYALFFACLSMTCWYWCWNIKTYPQFTAFLLAWSGVSFGIFSAAYLFKNPSWILGRNRSGESPVFLSWTCLLLNLPFLLICWLIWFVRNISIKEDAVNRIGETHIYVSRWPVFGVPLDSYDYVLDMTAEMPKLYRTKGSYISLPNLDGIPLTQWTIPSDIDRYSSILVHCAQGSGRSVVMAALLLLRFKFVFTAQEAAELLKKSRPATKLTKKQYEQIEYFEQKSKVTTERPQKVEPVEDE